METKFTPGEWKFYPMLTASENHKGFNIVGVHGSRHVRIGEVSPMVAVDGDDASPEAVANARLIVAAPELLTILRRYVSAYPAFRMKPIGADGSPARIEQENLMTLEELAQAAIAKATA